jgi:hypothetical protein
MSDTLKPHERLLTVKEVSEGYFQGKVSEREVYGLFGRGELRGFRVGSGRGRILIYESSIDAYRLAHENGKAEAEASPPPASARPSRQKVPTIRLTRLPQ